MNIPKPFVKKEKKSQSPLKGGSAMSSGNKTSRSCINMEELMQFEAARQRALTQVSPEETAKYLTDFVPHRVFINCINTFNGSYIADVLASVKRQNPKEEPGENDFESVIEENMFRGESAHEIMGEQSTFSSAREKDFSEVYEIIGSIDFLNNPKYSRPEGISELLDNENKHEFLSKLKTCGYIIYDITSDVYCHPKQIEEAKFVLESIVKCLEMMEEKQPKAFSKYNHCRVFILISTLLTWAKTKPIDPDDPSLPFTERDFRKRKPHPNYKIHCEFEKRVIELGKKYPNHLKTIVLGTGIPYGFEEDILHFYFKMAWQDHPFLPIFRPGTNILPVIHIRSLANVILMLIEDFPLKQKYIIAMDPHTITLKQLAKILAKNLGNGKTKMVDKEEALLYPDIKQRNFDMLSAHLNLVPGFIMDNVSMTWGTDLPFDENISELISEFKKARGLLPIKVFIHGPPGIGKTYLASRLSEYYDIPHLQEQTFVQNTVNDLKNRIEELTKKKELAEEKLNEEKIEIEGDEAAEDNEDDEEDEEGEHLDSLKQKLRDIEDNMENNDNKLDQDFILRLFKEKLSSNSCLNKGYVIDGYPETMEQTKILYAPDPENEGNVEEDEEEQGENLSRLCNLAIMPAYVESLDASDEFLINRVIRLPDINMTMLEEHDMCRRLSEFRALNTEDNTPLIFYDEMEVHPMIYNMENDPDPQLGPTLQAIINHIGPPRNYGKDLSAFDSILNSEREHAKIKQIDEAKAQREEVKKAAEERRKNLEKWMSLKNEELEMEEKALSVIGMPLRHYLMKYIFPCLTRGLVEVARLRPDDPVDFLSEFLFRENPEGKMFQPNYDEKEERLAQAIKEYESMMASNRTRESKSSKKSSTAEKSARSDAVSRVTDYKCSLVSSKSKKSTKSSLGSSKPSEKITSKKSDKSQESEGICTCQKSPSLSTCSSDRTPSTATSCTCTIPEPCEPCEPCTPEEKEDDCKCPCDR